MKRILCVLALAGAVFAQEAPKFELPPIGLRFYGFIKVDVSYDMRAGATVNDDLYFYTTTTSGDSNQFRIAAKQSRLGLDVSNGTFLGAKIEMDFSATPSTADLLTFEFIRMRHAYATVKLIDGLILTVGQTWHLLPLELPGTVNDAAFGYQGCLWGRVPQVRLSYAPIDQLKFNLAVTRPTRKMIDSEGTASGYPGAQASVWLGKLFDVKDVVAFDMTVMGGYEQWNRSTDGAIGHSYLIDVGGKIKLVNMVTINGQWWYGANLYDFFGSIGQMGYAGNEVITMGGFVNLKIEPIKELQFNFAAGIDDPEDSRVISSGNSRLMNVSFMANTIVKIFDKFSIALECDYIRTTHNVAGAADMRDNLHFMNSYRYDF